jgi:hypothetical protein
LSPRCAKKQSNGEGTAPTPFWTNLSRLYNLREQHEARNDNNLVAEYDDDDHHNNGIVVQQEIDNYMPQGLERVTLGTFHSICANILRDNGNLPVVIATDYTHHNIRVPPDILRNRVDNQIRPMTQGCLKVGRTKCVIHRQNAVSSFRFLGHASNIRYFQSGICWGLEPNQFRVSLKGNVFGEIAESNLNSVRWLYDAAKISLRPSIHIVNT